MVIPNLLAKKAGTMVLTGVVSSSFIYSINSELSELEQHLSPERVPIQEMITPTTIPSELDTSDYAPFKRDPPQPTSPGGSGSDLTTAEILASIDYEPATLLNCILHFPGPLEYFRLMTYALPDLDIEPTGPLAFPPLYAFEVGASMMQNSHDTANKILTAIFEIDCTDPVEPWCTLRSRCGYENVPGLAEVYHQFMQPWREDTLSRFQKGRAPHIPFQQASPPPPQN